jgi:hypothetical protein
MSATELLPNHAHRTNPAQAGWGIERTSLPAIRHILPVILSEVKDLFF